MKKTGIYSGSFNPVHNGHIALADYLLDSEGLDELWFIRSPHNPLKSQSLLMADDHRQKMLELAIEGHRNMSVSTIEDELPLPSYSYVTLRELTHRFPDREFYFIIGADNWAIFDKWRNWEEILADYHLLVYPRPGFESIVIDAAKYPNVRMVNAPLYDVSSTEVRDAIKKGKDVSTLIPTAVAEYIKENHLYNNEVIV